MPAMTNRTLRTVRTAPALSRPALGLALVVAASFALAPVAAQATADDVASLYGPQPPADATYLRVINLSTGPAKVALPGGARLFDLAPGAATALDVVRPGTPLRIDVDGKIAATPAGAAAVAGADTAGSIVTVALERDGASGWRVRPITAAAASADALRAQLRLFNFVDGCDAKVTLERSASTVVFDHVAPGHAGMRSINPVAATLVAVCGDVVSAPFALPRLTAGHSYSLILSGAATRPMLGGAADSLDWPASR